MLNTSIVATTTGKAMAMRRSWNPRRSLGIEGRARAEAMNIERNVTSATVDQKPLKLRAGWLSAAA